jgi:hypothetical protein
MCGRGVRRLSQKHGHAPALMPGVSDRQEAACERSSQLFEQGLGLLQIQCVKGLGEPAVDRGEKIVGLLSFTLVAPQPSRAHCRTEFPRFCLLLMRDGERTLEICVCLGCIRLGRHQRDFPGAVR